MNNRILAYITCTLCSIAALTTAQTPIDLNAEATRQYNRAYSLYEGGQLDTVPFYLNQIVNNDGIKRSARRNAYRLMANTYLALGQTELADSAYLGLLMLDPTFKPSISAGDLNEMVWLAKRFKNTAAWHLSLSVNLYKTAPNLITHQEDGMQIFKDFANDKYERLGDFSFGASINFVAPVGQYFEFTAGLDYQSFEFRHRYLFDTNGEISLGNFDQCEGRGSFTMVEGQNYLQIPIAFRFYPLRNDHYPATSSPDFLPFVQAGLGIQFLTDVSTRQFSSGIVSDTDPSQLDTCVHSSVNYPITDASDRVSNLNFTAHLGGGFKYKIKAHYVFVEASHSWQLTDTNSGEFPGQRLDDLHFVDNQFRLRFWSIKIGAAYSFYRPKLLAN